MEQQTLTPKTALIDYRALNNAFIHNITSASTKITKRCICIPVEDNFIHEDSYVNRNGREIRTAIGAVRLWPVSDDDRAAAAEKGIKNPKDYSLKLDISDKAMRDLEQRDPALAARLNFRNDGFDKEVAKQLLPYVGAAYEMRHRELPPEQVPTEEIQMQDGDDDLPF